MSSVKITYTFEFDPDEITVLLKLTGRESPDSIAALDLDVAAFERVYSTLSHAAFAPMREDHP
jgi:hypothetical protein